MAEKITQKSALEFVIATYGEQLPAEVKDKVDSLIKSLEKKANAPRAVSAEVKENAKLREENARIDALLKTAITRVGVVRFSAFQDMGSDLSYAVAMLDAHNDGVVFSSIFAREDSRSYVKPIENGHSSYTMTKEEGQALKNAIASAK